MGTDKSLFKDNEYIDSFRLTHVDREKDIQTLDELVKNKEKRDYLVKNSRETLNKYDVSNFSNKYLEVLREITHG